MKIRLGIRGAQVTFELRRDGTDAWLVDQGGKRLGLVYKLTGAGVTAKPWKARPHTRPALGTTFSTRAEAIVALYEGAR